MEQATVLPTDVLLVSFDLIHGEDNRLCIVGRKNGKMLEIVNAFEGQKAEDIFRLLTTVKPTHMTGTEKPVYDPFVDQIGKALEGINARAKKMSEEKT